MEIIRFYFFGKIVDMQGYILNIVKVRDEDCIVNILTDNRIIKSYRFYGARHPIITQGYKLDFELDSDINFLPKLRNAIHLGFGWLINSEKLLYWQQFMRLFFEHLKDVENIDNFYFNLIENCALKFSKQNPKRIIIESYTKILIHEGRLHKEEYCFLCGGIILDELSLARGFLPSHEKCLNRKSFNSDLIWNFFEKEVSMDLDDEIVSRLYDIVLEGF